MGSRRQRVGERRYSFGILNLSVRATTSQCLAASLDGLIKHFGCHKVSPNRDRALLSFLELCLKTDTSLAGSQYHHAVAGGMNQSRQNLSGLNADHRPTRYRVVVLTSSRLRRPTFEASSFPNEQYRVFNIFIR